MNDKPFFTILNTNFNRNKNELNKTLMSQFPNSF